MRNESCQLNGSLSTEIKHHSPAATYLLLRRLTHRSYAKCIITGLKPELILKAYACHAPNDSLHFSSSPWTDRGGTRSAQGSRLRIVSTRTERLREPKSHVLAETSAYPGGGDENIAVCQDKEFGYGLLNGDPLIVRLMVCQRRSKPRRTISGADGQNDLRVFKSPISMKRPF